MGERANGPMSKTYFISDTHFHHKNILAYEPSRLNELALHLGMGEDVLREELQKGYAGDAALRDTILDSHDRMIISKWNETVKGEDFVWFLGDFVCGSKALAREIASKLNGRKRMIKGNHDHWNEEFYRSIGFEYVSKYPLLLKNRFFLSHAPLDSCPAPFFNVFGHIHFQQSQDVPSKGETHRCVCVERTGFKPVRIEEYDKDN